MYEIFNLNVLLKIVFLHHSKEAVAAELFQQESMRNGRVHLQVLGMIASNETQRRGGLLAGCLMHAHLNCKWGQATCWAMKSQQHPPASKLIHNQ